MDNIFEQIKIRKLIFIYAACFFILSFWEIDLQIGYLLGNVVMLVWFVFTIKDKGKVSEVYEEFLIKVEWKKIMASVIVLSLFSIGYLEVLLYFVYQKNPELIVELLHEAAESYKTSSTLATLFLYLNIVLIGPILEEIMFRGIILNRLKVRWGINVGILVSSALFALMHLELAFIGAFVFAVFMCLLYLKTRNIMITMAVHILNNFWVMVFGLVTNNVFTNEGNESIYIDTSDLIVGMALFIPTTFYIIKYIKQNWPKKNIAPTVTY